jgi:hypothetical protein
MSENTMRPPGFNTRAHSAMSWLLWGMWAKASWLMMQLKRGVIKWHFQCIAVHKIDLCGQLGGFGQGVGTDHP